MAYVGSNQDAATHEHVSMHRQLGLTAKISLTIFFILSFCVLLIGFLNYFNFDKTLSTLIAQRYSVVDKDLQSSAEYGLSLGLAVSEIKNIQTLIAQTKRHYPSIDEISVFNTRGKRIFDTRPDMTGKPVPKAWLAGAKSRHDKQVHHGHYGAHYFVSASLFNSFDAPAGGVVVTYGRQAVQHADNAMLVYLGGMGALTLLIIATLVFLAVYLVTRRLKKSLGTIEGALTQTGSNMVSPRMHDSSLGAAFEEFTQKRKQVDDLFALAHRDLKSAEDEAKRT